MRKFALMAATAVAIAALGTTSAAQGHASGKGPNKGPHTGADAKSGGQSANRPSSTKGDVKGGGQSAKPPSSTKGDANGGGAATKASEHGSERDGEKKTNRPSASKDKSNGSHGKTTSTGTGGTATAQSASEPNAISAKISKNPNQLARLTAMLPAGITIEEASAGFRNQGQFIAALNASKNRQIDFVQLKEAMTVDGLSLGQAAKQLRPEPAPSSTPEQTGETTRSGS